MGHAFISRAFLAATTWSLVTLGTACGGGGGGGGPRSSNEPGDISLWLEKGAVDSGDLCRARVEVYNPNPDGIILKIRFPTTIRYSKNSAVLFPNEQDERPILPSFESVYEGFRYLVFFLSEEQIRYGDYSAIELNLKASQADPDALVSVDIDNNDLNIPDNREFNDKHPRFYSVEELELEIRGEGGPPVTPSPTPTKKAG